MQDALLFGVGGKSIEKRQQYKQVEFCLSSLKIAKGSSLWFHYELRAKSNAHLLAILSATLPCPPSDPRRQGKQRPPASSGMAATQLGRWTARKENGEPCLVCLVGRPLANLPILKPEALGMACPWMAWAWPKRQRTPWGILSAPSHLPIVTGEMRGLGTGQSLPFPEPWVELEMDRGSKGKPPMLAMEAFLKRERIWSWIDFSNSPWNEPSKISESEQLRSGRSSNVALGESRKGNRGQTPETRQGPAPLARCLRAHSLDNVRRAYICNVF